ncbi:diguanylate cyclase [Rhizosaccharibacter radicis]|uniref:diguanylate cyclase n=1 Tax=Rhizosaccharibacter radicis TaxID=2782605 RepID=A0ABT1VUZ0_9PROT|nr:diguanylate cyclase [Acetobacteraceae bacterium KSS12]
MFRLLAEHTSDVVMRLDASLIRRYVSPASIRVLGYRPEELVGGHPRGIIHAADWPRIPPLLEAARRSSEPVCETYRVRHRDGQLIWVEGSYAVLADGGFVVSLRDITRRKLAEQRLEAANAELVLIASRDGLTGLANRRRFDEMLAAEVRRAACKRHPLSLVLLDVDRFKLYNDGYGHQAGDDCLRLVATAIGGAVRRPDDLVARYGGEEFAVLLPGLDENEAAAIGERIRLAVRTLALTHHANRTCGGLVTASVGCAGIRPEDLDPGGPVADLARKLLHEADRALYEGKRRGRDRVVRASDVPSSPEAPAIDGEAARLDAVARFRDRCADAALLDRFARIAATLLDMPIGFVSLVERDGVVVTGRHNLPPTRLPGRSAFCAHTITGPEALVVEDAREDPRFRDGAKALGVAAMRFYAGVPLVMPDGNGGGGHRVGALCVADNRPRATLDAAQRLTLSTLAGMIVREVVPASDAERALPEPVS